MLNVRLFGKFCLQNENLIWEASESCKMQELLCYLLIHPILLRQREHLASLLWAESSTAQSKKYLRQALWQLQVACESRLGLAHSRLIVVSTDCVSINPKIDLQSDVSDFEAAYAELQPGVELDSAAVKRLMDAVRLYRGDLLEGCYQEWCLYERERLQNMYLKILDRLIVYCEAHQEYDAALSYGERVLHSDPARERAHQQMMRIYYWAGDRTAALRQFDQCVEALKKELDVSPSKKTLALYEQIRADQLDPGPLDSSQLKLALESPAALPAFLNHLTHLQATVTDLQKQLLHEIHLVEQYLTVSRDRV